MSDHGVCALSNVGCDYAVQYVNDSHGCILCIWSWFPPVPGISSCTFRVPVQTFLQTGLHTFEVSLKLLASRVCGHQQGIPRSGCWWSSIFMSRLMTSLKRSWGRPLALSPCANSLYSKSFGILPSSILLTCSSQRRQCYFSIVYMLGRFAHWITSLFVIRSCHVMPIIATSASSADNMSLLNTFVILVLYPHKYNFNWDYCM